MLTPDQALSSIPEGLRRPLIDEFSNIINNYMERKWRPAELSGGRFCEIVYTIIDGYSSGLYQTSPTKPRNFLVACRRLENNSSMPRSFQILIPRLLPALYEIRNNRNVGHVGGDVDPDHMDSSAVVSISSWILAEIIRVFHGVSTEEAQKLVDLIVERRSQIVWKSSDMRRVLKPGLPLKDQILILLGSNATKVQTDNLFVWTDYDNRSYFNKILRKLHDSRFLEFNVAAGEIELLPPGYDEVEKILNKIA
jgi:hypothetical protein